MTYRNALNLAAGLLRGAEIEYAENESRLLMEYVCQADLGFYLLHAAEEMPEDLAKQYFALVDSRCGHEPLQYLTGEQEFMGIPIRVNDAVLIPRQDTEILAGEAIRILRNAEGNPRVLDLCTGSGCLAVAIKSFCPDAEVTGCDLSAEALRVAARNAAENGLDVKWIESDLFSAVEGWFDLIVSNPPYIPTDVLDTLMPEVRDHEPRLALDGGPDGLDFYRRILADCPSFLVPGGYLLFEIGSDQANLVADLMKIRKWKEIRIRRDLAGQNRVVSGRRGKDAERM